MRYVNGRTVPVLCIHKIDTSAQLQAFVDSTNERMAALIRQRIDLQNRLRRAVDPEAIAAMREEKARVTAQIQPLLKDLKTAAGVVENTVHMKVRMAMIRRLEVEDRQKQQQKSKSQRERNNAR